MRTDQLDYELPPDRIAAHPARRRDDARLMVVHRESGRIEHAGIRDLPSMSLFGPGDLLVVNRSRVISARFEATRCDTGGQVRGLYICRPEPGRWLLLLESRGTPRADERLRLSDDTHIRLIESRGGGRWLGTLEGDDHILQRVGRTPLPPYITRARRRLGEPESSPEDPERYNTVYADDPGSVAAPTAGLHFTPRLLASLEAVGVRRAGVTLHVGPGTFAPIRSDDLTDHRMEAEWIEVPSDTIAALSSAERVTAVGTTTVRALESLPDPPGGAHRGPTDLFITPGFQLRFTDRLLTNFHLPRSTLLALVAALPGVGVDRLLSWYRVAVDRGYRFYSYGDAMLLV